MSSGALCNVQQKIPCVFETIVVQGSSTKRAHQPYKVLAGETVRSSALEAGLVRATEKIDGTCAFVAEFDGSPWLWARHDRKPNKAADKRFKKFQQAKRLLNLENTSKENESSTDRNHHSALREDQGNGDTKSSDFTWALNKDFKDVPESWIPASRVPVKDGLLLPDTNGHIPGWVPVELKSRQHCWHLSAVDLEQGVALVLQPKQGSLANDDIACIGFMSDIELEIVCRSLADLCGYTMELIGTNINGNPYGLGSKEKPLHLLVRHGTIPVNHPIIDRTELINLFQNEVDGQIEGIVWHCSNGDLFKLHRHHLELTWPVPTPRLVTLPVSIAINYLDKQFKPVFSSLQKFNSTTFVSLCDIYK